MQEAFPQQTIRLQLGVMQGTRVVKVFICHKPVPPTVSIKLYHKWTGAERQFALKAVKRIHDSSRDTAVRITELLCRA